jgi:hypothetical protein
MVFMRTITSIITSDGKALGDVLVVRESVRAIQKTKVMRGFNTLEGYVTYDGHRVDAKSPVSLKSSVPALLQDLRLYHWEGKVYSGDGKIFVKEFAECLTCFLKGFLILLRQSNTRQKIKRITITASEVEDGLRWLAPVMKSVGCCIRSKEILIENVIKKLENQGVC